MQKYLFFVYQSHGLHDVFIDSLAQPFGEEWLKVPRKPCYLSDRFPGVVLNL